MEIGDHGLNSGDDDRFSIDNPRISHTIPTFHIQTFDDHSHLVRNLPSIDSIHNNNNNNNHNHHHHHNPNNHYHQHQLHYPDDLPERSQSSLSCINRMLDETITNKLFPHNQQSQQDRANNSKDTKTNSTTATTACTTTALKLNNFLSPDTYKKNKESVSLPGTLKKKRSSSDSCRGSNNCYIKAAAADLKQLAVKIEKGCPKSRTAIVRQASDDEHLLDNDNNTVDITTEPASAGIKATKSSALNTDGGGGGDDTVSSALTKSQGALRKTSGGSSSGAPATATSSSSSSSVLASAVAIVPPQIRIEIEPSLNHSVGDDSTTNQRPR